MKDGRRILRDVRAGIAKSHALRARANEQFAIGQIIHQVSYALKETSTDLAQENADLRDIMHNLIVKEAQP